MLQSQGCQPLKLGSLGGKAMHQKRKVSHLAVLHNQLRTSHCLHRQQNQPSEQCSQLRRLPMQRRLRMHT